MAIEKDGRIGLQRQPSGDSSFSGRKLSADTEATSILQDSTRTNVSSPDTSRSDFRGPSGPGVSPPGPSSTEPAGQPTPFAGRIPTNALASASLAGPPPGGLPTPGSASGGKPNVQEGLAASPQIRQAPRGRSAEGPSGGSSNPDKAAKESAAQPVRDQNEAEAKGSKDPLNGPGFEGRDPSGGSSGNSGAGGTAQIATALKGEDKAKASKPVTTSLGSSTPSSKTKPAGKGPNPAPKPSATPPPTGKPAAEKKKTPSTISPGFVKPRPKSPTRPLELPSRLTQPTAAAAAKNKNAPPPTTYRPASRTATSGKGLGRSSSVASRQRPSFGPPPKQPAKDHPVPKKEAKVDEGFLARMMRPTQASANKVAEKVTVPTTPPRNRAASTNKKSASAKSGPTRRIASRTASTTNSAAATPETKKEAPPAKIVAKKVEQIPITEETISVVKRPGGNVPLKISEEKVITPEVEKKADSPAAMESKVDASGPTEKLDLLDVSDKKMEDSQTIEVEDVTNSAEKEVLNASENKENVPNHAENNSGVTKPSEAIEKAEPALKSPEKPSDAMFAAFMNPGSPGAEATKANGNHEKGENGDALASAVDSKAGTKPGPVDSQTLSDGLSGVAEAEYDEQETW